MNDRYRDQIWSLQDYWDKHPYALALVGTDDPLSRSPKHTIPQGVLVSCLEVPSYNRYGCKRYTSRHSNIKFQMRTAYVIYECLVQADLMYPCTRQNRMNLLIFGRHISKALIQKIPFLISSLTFRHQYLQKNHQSSEDAHSQIPLDALKHGVNRLPQDSIAGMVDEFVCT